VGIKVFQFYGQNKKELIYLCDPDSPNHKRVCRAEDADGKTILFSMLKELEAQGVAAYIEDSEGRRLS
jgi:hypothetical protein